MERQARFEDIYRAHGGAVRTFVHRRADSSIADDVVAEVFLAVWRRLDGAPDDLLPWLFGIARGLLANRRRGDARRHALQERLATTSVPELDPGPGEDVDESPVLQALAGLSESDQELLRLIAWDGLDHARAAQTLQIKPSVFYLRLHRARRRLRRAMATLDIAVERRAGQQPQEVCDER